MYFVNMCGKEGIGTFRKNNEIPFVNHLDETTESYITLKNGKLVVSNGGENLFKKGIVISDEPYLPKVKSGLTCREVRETEENPLIIVLCDYIEVFDRVPANIKFFHLDDGEDNKILAMLVYGACSFNGVPMQRCNETELSGKRTKKLLSKDIKGITRSIDNESEYNYIDDAVIQLAIKYNETSSGSCLSGKICMEGTEIFNMKKIKAHREHVQKVKAIQEQRRIEEENKKKQEALERERRLEAERKAKEEELERESSEGVREFLAALGVAR